MTINKLKKLIKVNGLKQSFIAERIGISKGHLNKVLKGTHPLTNELSDKLDLFVEARGLNN